MSQLGIATGEDSLSISSGGNINPNIENNNLTIVDPSKLHLE